MRRAHAIGFIFFCLLSTGGWLVENVYPSPFPILEQQALHSFVVVLAALAILLLRRARLRGYKPVLRTRSFHLAAAGILLLGLPAWCNQLADSFSISDGVSLFALVPLLLIVGAEALPINGFASSGRTLMLPALAGFFGALLLPSFHFPAAPQQFLQFAALLLSVLFTVAGSLWIYPLLQDWDVPTAVVLISAANLVFLGILILHGTLVLSTSDAVLIELARSLLLVLPQMFLFVWLLRALPPLQMGVRFLAIPLFSVLEGLALLRPPLDLRLVACIILMSISGAIIFFAKPHAGAEEPSVLHLR